MAEIESFDIKDDKMLLTLRVKNDEYQLLRASTGNIAVLPTDSSVLEDVLTTGKLGNGNRIMIPNKFLERNNVQELKKRVHSKIFDLNGGKFLLIKLDDLDMNMPCFE